MDTWKGNWDGLGFLLRRDGQLTAGQGASQKQSYFDFQQGQRRRHALHPAAMHGHKNVVEFLLASKAEVNAKSNKRLHALAPCGGSWPQGRGELLLANKADVNAKDAEFVWTPLHWAAGGGTRTW